MLPENELFWPPITIRVVDCRKFGRDVLVGTCTITQVQKYIWVPPEERERQQEEIRKKKLLMLPIAERKRQERLQVWYSFSIQVSYCLPVMVSSTNKS